MQEEAPHRQSGRHSAGKATVWDEIDIWFTRNRLARVTASAMGASVLLALLVVLGAVL